VSSSKEYREYADECLGWARTARSDRERAIFLQMAQTWLEAVVRLEARQSHRINQRGNDGLSSPTAPGQRKSKKAGEQGRNYNRQKRPRCAVAVRIRYRADDNAERN
jgi:hypothetical protein